MSKPKRLRSAVTGKIQTETEAAANPRESVTETVRPPSVEIDELVGAIDNYFIGDTIVKSLLQCDDFPNRDRLIGAIKTRIEEQDA